MRYDAIIIGAGLSGLAAGVRLAHFGKKTLILERHYRVGGLNSFYRAGGYDMDVGLHAITNYNPGSKSSPLYRLMRRLRLRYDDLGLYPQKESGIVFPGARLKFSNDSEYLLSQVESVFPGQADGVRQLMDDVKSIFERGFDIPRRSGREAVYSFISEPLLAEMILCPVMYYGSPMEDDIDYAQFAVLFYSMFLEGLARPRGGIRPLLDLLVSRFEEAGGELRPRAGVSKINVKDGAAVSVVLDNGDVVECGAVLSSAGIVETFDVCPEARGVALEPEPGVMSFAETINVLDRPAAELGITDSIIFYSGSDRFNYRRPEEPVDTSSGVICVPGNFSHGETLEYESVRVTNIADSTYWESLDKEEYAASKKEWRSKTIEALSPIAPGFTENSVTFYDMFTPRTISRFTGHVNGAVYGSPSKVWDGATAVGNLFICGADQGLPGVVGAMISGVETVNRRLMA